MTASQSSVATSSRYNLRNRSQTTNASPQATPSRFTSLYNNTDTSHHPDETFPDTSYYGSIQILKKKSSQWISFELEEPCCSIGSSDDCDIKVDRPQVELFHTFVQVHEDNHSLATLFALSAQYKMKVIIAADNVQYLDSSVVADLAMDNFDSSSPSDLHVFISRGEELQVRNGDMFEVAGRLFKIKLKNPTFSEPQSPKKLLAHDDISCHSSFQSKKKKRQSLMILSKADPEAYDHIVTGTTLLAPEATPKRVALRDVSNVFDPNPSSSPFIKDLNSNRKCFYTERKKRKMTSAMSSTSKIVQSEKKIRKGLQPVKLHLFPNELEHKSSHLSSQEIMEHINQMDCLDDHKAGLTENQTAALDDKSPILEETHEIKSNDTQASIEEQMFIEEKPKQSIEDDDETTTTPSNKDQNEIMTRKISYEPSDSQEITANTSLKQSLKTNETNTIAETTDDIFPETENDNALISTEKVKGNQFRDANETVALNDEKEVNVHEEDKEKDQATLEEELASDQNTGDLEPALLAKSPEKDAEQSDENKEETQIISHEDERILSLLDIKLGNINSESERTSVYENSIANEKNISVKALLVEVEDKMQTATEDKMEEVHPGKAEGTPTEVNRSECEMTSVNENSVVYETNITVKVSLAEVADKIQSATEDKMGEVHSGKAEDMGRPAEVRTPTEINNNECDKMPMENNAVLRDDSPPSNELNKSDDAQHSRTPEQTEDCIVDGKKERSLLASDLDINNNVGPEYLNEDVQSTAAEEAMLFESLLHEGRVIDSNKIEDDSEDADKKFNVLESSSQLAVDTCTRLHTSPEEIEKIKQDAIKQMLEESKIISAAYDEVLHRYDDLLVERDELKDLTKQYEATINKLVEQDGKKASAQLTASHNENNRLKAELVTVTEVFGSLKTRYSKAKEAIVTYDAKEKELIQQIHTLKKGLKDMEIWANEHKERSSKKINTLQNEVQTTKENLFAAEEKSIHLGVELEASHRRLVEKESSLVESMDLVMKLEKTLDSEKQKLSELTHQYENQIASYVKIKEDLEHANTDIVGLRSSHQELRNNNEEMKARLEALQKERLELVKERDELIQNAQELKELKGQQENLVYQNQQLKAKAYDNMNVIESLRADIKVLRENDRAKMSDLDSNNQDREALKNFENLVFEMEAKIRKLTQENTDLSALCEELVTKLEGGL